MRTKPAIFELHGTWKARVSMLGIEFWCGEYRKGERAALLWSEVLAFARLSPWERREMMNKNLD